jgi:hypothetical protein
MLIWGEPKPHKQSVFDVLARTDVERVIPEGLAIDKVLLFAAAGIVAWVLALMFVGGAIFWANFFSKGLH